MTTLWPTGYKGLYSNSRKWGYFLTQCEQLPALRCKDVCQSSGTPIRVQSLSVVSELLPHLNPHLFSSKPIYPTPPLTFLLFFLLMTLLDPSRDSLWCDKAVASAEGGPSVRPAEHKQPDGPLPFLLSSPSRAVFCLLFTLTLVTLKDQCFQFLQVFAGKYQNRGRIGFNLFYVEFMSLCFQKLLWLLPFPTVYKIHVPLSVGTAQLILNSRKWKFKNFEKKKKEPLITHKKTYLK